MIPDWLVNIHPVVVHFPVGLLILGVVLDVARVALKPASWLNKTTLVVYSAGLVGLVAAYLTGQRALESVEITGQAFATAASHEDWALYTLIFFIALLSLRFLCFWKGWDIKAPVRGALAVIAISGGGFLWMTGELGAKLVFKHGVAVSEVENLRGQLSHLELQLAQFREEAEVQVRDDGSWVWRITRGADKILRERFVIHGDPGFAVSIGREDGFTHLGVTPGDGRSFLLFGEPLQAIEGRIQLDVSDFDGEVSLVHHFQDQETYQYLTLNRQGVVVQGRLIAGENLVLESKASVADSWDTLRVTAQGRHFYGYRGQQMLTHTHGEEMLPGLTGISFSGAGVIKVRAIQFDSL